MTPESKARVDKLIIHGQLVTMDDALTLIEDGAIAISGAEIVAVGPTSDLTANYQALETIDASGQIVMPGLINAHTHAAGNLFRGMVINAPLYTRLERYWAVERKFCRPETINLGSRLAYGEMIRSGTTTALDMYLYPEASAEAARQIRFRLLAGPGYMDIDNPPDDIPIEERTARGREFMQQYKGDQWVTPIVKPHSVYSVPPEYLIQAKALADEFDTLFHTHAAESAQEITDVLDHYNTTSIEHLENLGLLDENTVLAHCVHLKGREVALLAERNTAAVHCPVNNLRGGSGIAPVKEMLEAGVPVLLGTDGAMRGNPLEMWTTMRLASFIHRGLHQDPTIVPDLEVVKMATCNAAKALGINAGSLEPGKLADIIMIDVDSPHVAPITPLNEIYAPLVTAVGRENVSTVIINGKTVMQRREMLTMDLEGAMKEVNEISLQVAAFLETL